jgi:hypothetical protein
MSEQAFPSDGYVDERTGDRWNVASGMTLRDYFAAKALQGMLASEGYEDRMNVTIPDYASDAYRYADAMLKAREA